MGERRAARILRTGLDALLAVTLSPQCAACGIVLDSPSRGPVCPACWNRIPLITEPLFSTPLIARGCAAGDYDGALRNIIHAFKYEGRRGLAKPLARMAADAGRRVLDGVDLLVPVPLHVVKRLHRGFNQAEDLAIHVGPRVARVLWRTKLTRSQTGLGANDRHRNVGGAFRIAPLTRRRMLAGAVVVLVDDVRTTGATLNACAEVLLGAGASEVRALTIARAALVRPV